MNTDTDRDLAALFADAPPSPDDTRLALAIVHRIDVDQRRRGLLLGAALVAGVAIAGALVTASGLVPFASMTMRSAAAQLSPMLSAAAATAQSGGMAIALRLDQPWMPPLLGSAGVLAALGAIAGALHRGARS